MSQARADVANPSAGILAQIQTQIVSFQQQVNTALLQAARITDADSQKLHFGNPGAATIVNAIFSLLQSISSQAALAMMATQSTSKVDDNEKLPRYHSCMPGYVAEHRMGDPGRHLPTKLEQRK